MIHGSRKGKQKQLRRDNEDEDETEEGINGSDKGQESDEDDAAGDDAGDFEIDDNPNIEATADDKEAMLGTTITDFEPGDVVGKVMAFVNQVRASSEPTRDFLKQLCPTNGCKPREFKLWVKSRWGSLSDCFEVVLGMRRVGRFFGYMDQPYWIDLGY